jgi:hypothetical protein
MRYVMCVNNEGYAASLEERKVYQVIDDDWGEAHRMLRVIDESGEDYLFEANRFAPVDLTPEAAAIFDQKPS